MMPLPKKPKWIVSPPLVPELGAIDAGHLQRMTLGEPALEREVLALFARQCRDIREQLVREELVDGEPHFAFLAHTLKGSARGIGAFAVADAADWLERQSRAGGPVEQAVATLDHAIVDALAAIAERLGG